MLQDGTLLAVGIFFNKFVLLQFSIWKNHVYISVLFFGPRLILNNLSRELLEYPHR